MPKPNEVDRLVSSLSEDIRQSFQKKRRILSFGEFVQLLCERPELYARSSAQYILDAFDHFGSYMTHSPKGETRRYKLFDGLGGSEHYLIGQEDAQNAVYRILTNFIRQGRVNRLVLLHGPNGSAKSSLIGCIARAMELYSETDDGALYKFNWIFPTEKISRGAIGFGGRTGSETSSLPTYAFLEDLEVTARLTDAMRDSPLLLVPKRDRRALLEKHAKTGRSLGDYVLEGDLSTNNKIIFETLLAAYHGDYAEVLKHVQVERFFVSRRYRVGLATVGPEMRVDAGLRQLTMDRTLSALPGGLQGVTLYEPTGDLVDGNRGMIEFNDLLKRPMELNRYLLATSETGTVPLDSTTLYLDSFLIGTVNEAYLDALKGQPDWASYKGRFELVRMPYLLDYTTEKSIYEVQLEQVEISKPRAPHVCELAAMWAVLTRLQKPNLDKYPKSLRAVLKELTPLQKARLYANGELPDEVGGDAARELRAAIADLFTEAASSGDYEGRYGASPREIKTILLNAAHDEVYTCFSPMALFEELKKLVEDPSVYEFLQLKPDGEYHQPADFVEVVKQVYLDRLDNEVRTSMGLIEEAQYEQLFAKYVDHVNHWVQKEKLVNPVSGQYESPDEGFMAEVEKRLGVEGDKETYRHGIISSIGAFRIEHPDDPVVYSRIFERKLEALKRRFFEEQREAIRKIKINLLRYFDEDIDELAPSDKVPVERTLSNLKTRFGYTHETAREAIGFLVRHRYGEPE